MDFDKYKLPIVLSVIVFILLVIFVIGPGITGYGIYKDMKSEGVEVGTYGKTLTETQKALEMTEHEVESCEEKTSDWKSEFTDCINTQKSLQEDYYDLEKELALEQQKKELTQKDNWEDKYYLLAENTAKNICCKEKVDNPKINSYEFKGDMIVCTVGGENKLDC